MEELRRNETTQPTDRPTDRPKCMLYRLNQTRDLFSHAVVSLSVHLPGLMKVLQDQTALHKSLSFSDTGTSEWKFLAIGYTKAISLSLEMIFQSVYIRQSINFFSPLPSFCSLFSYATFSSTSSSTPGTRRAYNTV